MAEPRPAAEPRSPGQKARRSRILRAAAQLGAEHGLDGVQMHDVAKDAGVAIATLYRYFPSKTHLFTAVLSAQVDHMRDPAPEIDHAAPVDAVAETLIRSTRGMLKTPRLARAMLQSNNDAHTATVSEAAEIDIKVQDALLAVLGLEAPSEKDLQLLSLLMKCWHGVVVSALNGHSSQSAAENDIRLATEALLAARADLTQADSPTSR